MLSVERFASSGVPTLVLHGLFGSKQNWRSLAKQASRSLDLVTVDLRNHGASFHAPSMTYADMANDITTLVNNLQLPRANIIGHSMGGKVAMHLALQNPHWLHKSVIVDMAPLAASQQNSAPFRAYIDAMKQLDAFSPTTHAQADKLLEPLVPVLLIYLGSSHPRVSHD